MESQIAPFAIQNQKGLSTEDDELEDISTSSVQLFAEEVLSLVRERSADHIRYIRWNY